MAVAATFAEANSSIQNNRKRSLNMASNSKEDHAGPAQMLAPGQFHNHLSSVQVFEDVREEKMEQNRVRQS